MRFCIVLPLIVAVLAHADITEQGSNTEENLRGVSVVSPMGISRKNSEIWVVGAKGAIFLIDGICRSCAKK